MTAVVCSCSQLDTGQTQHVQLVLPFRCFLRVEVTQPWKWLLFLPAGLGFNRHLCCNRKFWRKQGMSEPEK